MRALMIAAALAVATGTAAQATNTVEGEARVIDGDTVVVAGVTVRLKGVDAPEQANRYGPDATNGLRAIVGDWLRCELTGEKTRKREVGYCVNAAGRDIGEAIIKNGLALACEFYSDRYVSFEQPEAVARLTRATYCTKKKKVAQVLAGAEHANAIVLLVPSTCSQSPLARGHRNVDVPEPVRHEGLTLAEVEDILSTWKLRGPHGG
jgi:micrococcal nuclease